MKTMKVLSMSVTSKEGKKVQVSKAQVDEILGIVSDEVFADPTIGAVLFNNGKRRAKPKRKKK